MRPDFDDLYFGEWPYNSTDGVGLKLEGLPRDRDQFIAFLMDYSCHPAAGARIYARIQKNGFDLLTVMSHLPFNEIARGLLKFGVRMSIIAPELNWTQKYDDGPYPIDFVPPHR